ncbi:MAG TPA: sulfite reductase subunit A [Gammaproteobacteria bacterium]|nr:sulfite reductase subunit A [Gammaproteobacteria bacterium]
MEAPRSVNSFLPRKALDALLSALRDGGYDCAAPVVRDGAVVYTRLQAQDRLPHGISIQQAPGRYRVGFTDSPRNFSWANGPQALKPFVFTAHETLWSARRDPDGNLCFTEPDRNVDPVAIIGVRSCDLAALALQDRHFLDGACADPHYQARRASLFLVAVNCSHPSDTCFCVSTGDGPAASDGYDLLLDELDDGFVIQAGSPEGQKILDRLPVVSTTDRQLQDINRQNRHAAECQTRRLPPGNLEPALFANLDHPHWQTVAERCLSCGNCTSVCPTCFCYRELDQGTLDSDHSEHIREWDSCFTQGHSYIHGVTIRAGTDLRYRQWLAHKLGSWHSQYGRSGCVGCGRCISWCPVGIDLTEEVATIVGAAS